MRARLWIGATIVGLLASGALAGETLLRDESGEPTAALCSTAYVETGVQDPASRPVVFLYNGG